MRVLVTGSRGFLGQRITRLLEEAGHTPIGADIDHSVLSPGFWSDADAAIHLAACKYAPYGEDHPEQVAELNVQGTANVCRVVPKVVLASTCKAAAPITVYGASKLIAERIVLNAGGTVVRLVNVVGSTGSVSEIWEQLPPHEPLPVTDCERMFMGPDQAAGLLVQALNIEPGRYAPETYRTLSTAELASELYPGRAMYPAALRKGDRPVERLLNDYEHPVGSGSAGLVRIKDLWEDAPTEEALAA